MKPTFVTRTNRPDNKSNVVDAQKLINYFLSLSPQNTVIPNSPLYNLAIKQYNVAIENTTARPPVPSWFCGKVNPDTNQLIPDPIDSELRANSGVVSDSIANVSPPLPTTLSLYPTDECLQLGTPGSAPYALCDESLSLERLETSGIDWIASLAVQHQEPEIEIESEGSGNSFTIMDNPNRQGKAT